METYHFTYLKLCGFSQSYALIILKYTSNKSA